MENFQEFLESFRLQHFAVGGAANLVINTLAMWFVVNQFANVEGKVSVWRCAVCALLLYGVSAGAIALLLFPLPLIFILAVVVWLFGSMLVIRSVFELTNQEGGGILFMYLMLLYLIHFAAKYFLA